MNSNPQCKWDSLSESFAEDPIAGYDRLRHQCAVAHSERFHWSLFKHADVMRVLGTPGSFSNVVSRHLSVPNGMDPPIHGAYRRMIDCYFSPARMDEFEPICREIAVKRVAALPVNGDIELMREFAELYATEIQCGFLEWPAGLHEPLRRNMSDLRNIVSKGIDPVKSTQADYRILGDQIQTQVAAIGGQCKLAPAADEVFHTFIVEIIAGALILQGQTTQPPHRGLQTIVRALDRYGIYFDQPGWRAIHRDSTSRRPQ